MFCNRGIYHEGWTAVTRHSTPFVVGTELPAFDDDVWELYAPDDWTQSNDIAADNPAKLAELQRVFLIEGVKYGVFHSTTVVSNGSTPISPAGPRS